MRSSTLRSEIEQKDATLRETVAKYTQLCEEHRMLTTKHTELQQYVETLHKELLTARNDNAQHVTHITTLTQQLDVRSLSLLLALRTILTFSIFAHV
jgi:chromosome segregation ATPase